MSHLVWDASPVIFSIGPIQLRWYSILFVGSFLLGVYIMKWVFTREEKDTELVDIGLMYVLIGAVVGARLVHCFAYQPDYFLAHPIEIFKIWKGGLASHGGILGVVIALFLFARKYRLSPAWLISRITLPGLLSATLIRLGNFFNSEIVGLPSDAPWAVIFQKIDTTPRHPVQLYESLAYFILFFIFIWLYKKLSPEASTKYLGGLLLISVFGVRFVLEYFKTHQADYNSSLPLTVGQMLSIPAILIGLVWIILSYTKTTKPST